MTPIARSLRMSPMSLTRSVAGKTCCMSLLAIVFEIPVIALLLAFTAWAERSLSLSETNTFAIGGLIEDDKSAEAGSSRDI